MRKTLTILFLLVSFVSSSQELSLLNKNKIDLEKYIKKNYSDTSKYHVNTVAEEDFKYSISISDSSSSIIALVEDNVCVAVVKCYYEYDRLKKYIAFMNSKYEKMDDFTWYSSGIIYKMFITDDGEISFLIGKL